MAVAIEDAGFITHPMIGWAYGSGFPKATDASRMIDQALSAKGAQTDGASGKGSTTITTFGDGLNVNFEQRPAYISATPEAADWQGWYYGGQVRKPALEPICVAQKPFSEKNGALNILRWGVGAVNIDGCRVARAVDDVSGWSISGSKESENVAMSGKNYTRDPKPDNELGRWPANLMHDGSPEVLALFPDAPGQFADASRSAPSDKTSNVYGKMRREGEPSADRRYTENGSTNFAALPGARRNDTGSAARFF